MEQPPDGSFGKDRRAGAAWYRPPCSEGPHTRQARSCSLCVLEASVRQASVLQASEDNAFTRFRWRNHGFPTRPRSNRARTPSSSCYSLPHTPAERIAPKHFSTAELTERTPVFHSDEQLHSVLETLEECRKVLSENNGRETAELLSVAILDLRMRLKGIAHCELRALCDEMLRGTADGTVPQSNPAREPARRPLLRVVK